MARIYNENSNTLVSGTSGHDYIESSYVENVTINAGNGNDTINNYGSSNGIIDGGAGNDRIYNSGDAASAASNVTINAGAGKDSIYNWEYGDSVAINAGADDDLIENIADVVTIDGGDGNDYISNRGNSVTISAGAGNDTIINNYRDYYSDDGLSDTVSIAGGAGNDVILINGGLNLTIDGGAGDDSINGSGGENTYFKHTSGNDSISGFHDTDTLVIATTTYTTAVSGKNVVVTTGTGTITLIDAASFADSIYIETGTDTTSGGGGGDDTQSGGGGGDDTQSGGDTEGKILTNKTAKTSLAGTAYDDEFYNRANTVTIKGGDGGDYLATQRKTSSVKLYGEAGDDTLEANNATKVLLDGGAGNDDIYSSGKQNTIVGGTGNDTIEIDSTDTQIQYKSGDGNDLVVGFNDTTTLKIGDGKTDTYYSEKVGDDVIVTVGDGILTLNGAADLWVDTLNDGKGGLSNIQGVFTGNTLIVTTSPVTLDANIEIADASKRTKATKITGNDLDNSIVGGTGKDTLYGGDGADTLDGGAGADKLYGQAGDDSLFGGAGNDLLNGGDGEDTLWGGAGNDTLTGGNDADVFIYSGGKDVITDYVSGEDIISIGAAISDASIKGSDVVLTINKSTLTIKNAKYKDITFINADGEDYTTMYGGVNLDNSSKSPYALASDVELANATARTKAIKITGNELNNSIIGGSGKDTIYGGEGTDSLLGGAGADKLYGDEGEDTLWGGAGNDTLTGGDDDDVFIYTGGKDVIADYASGEDKISLGAAYTSTLISGNDVVLTINNSNTLKIKNAKYEEITFINASGEEYTESFGGVKFDSSSAAKQTLAAGVEFANAKSRSKAIEIVGNEMNNTILGGSGKDTLYGEDGEDSLLGGAGADKLYGGDGDDTLVGGAGADSLWGGEGSDTFVYAKGDGKDVISGFEEEDMLLITGVDLSEITASKSSSALVLTIDKSNTITFKAYATDTFNINGDSYEVKGNQLVKTDD